jgi:hypothetical protein
MIERYIFLGTLIVCLPLIGVLLYVWHTFGKGDRGVSVARTIFSVGVVFLFLSMIFV